jgi:DNA invertase Pin-like site-specific DNA recombinase
MIAQTRVAI